MADLAVDQEVDQRSVVPDPQGPLVAVRDAAAGSPMMGQYLEAKSAYPGCLLFFRMGDFYEMFFDDAVTAARALNITLTRRGQHKGEEIPMAGVPVHSHESYLARLIRQGFRVAICDQTESPAEAKKRSGKTLVRRDVVRVVTPGTVTEDTLLEARRNNYLAALGRVGGRDGSLGLAHMDISTGEFTLEPSTPTTLAAALARLSPGEILLSEGAAQDPALAEALAEWTARLTVQPDSRFDSENARRRLTRLFGVATLDAFGAFSRAEIAAGGALVDYVDLTQKGRLPRLEAPRRLAAGAIMEIDAATRRNLELTVTLAGDGKGSLLNAIDRTVSGPGARLLAAHLAAPLTDAVVIRDRLDAVQHFVESAERRERLRAHLRSTPDMERALSRLSVGRGGPRDLSAVRDGLTQAHAIRGLLAGNGPATTDPLNPVPALVAAALDDIGDHGPLVDRLAQALGDDLPPVVRDGGFIAAGYSEDLDRLRLMRDDSRRLIAGLQSRYQEDTGIAILKIRHNNVLGYFIEVSAQHVTRLTGAELSATFIHRQTLSNAGRFTTVELSNLERDIADAAEKALALELALFDDLCGAVEGRAREIAAAARALAVLDVAAAHAEQAVTRRYARPHVDDSLDFRIVGGRHPVVEQVLADTDGGAFVANQVNLSPDSRLWLVTGPNMAGKSTFLRQNALIAIMAQIGAYVPAESAHIGAVDRLFSRVGASDDLARGRSTFMVEMIETASILNQAGSRALVILDEIGRGTATFDGLSIAWACLEYLHESNACRGLFATHYHELTALATRLSALSCHSMRVKEWRGDIVFLHEVVEGSADRSYGIHVAKLAGLPPAVVARAQAVLDGLEREGKSRAVAELAEDLPLFMSAAARAPAGAVDSQPSAVEQRLGAVNPDMLTPRAALDLLYEMKALLGESPKAS